MLEVKISTIKKIVQNLKNPGNSLGQRAVRGGFWVFLLQIIQELFNLGRLVILARVLSPGDFGLMGIALLTMATLETFTQTGFQAALIQKREEISSYLDCAWTTLILRGFTLVTILYLIAPYVALFFDTPEATPIIQIIGLSILLQAFTNIGVIYFQKELEFNKQFIYQFAGTLADFAVAISSVLILQSVWALVFGLLAGNAARCIISYIIHPYRPHFCLDVKKAKELFGFGKWIFGSGVLVFLSTQGDDIIVGKVLGATALGFYQMAYRISNMPATEITHVISQVTFPAYAKLQHNIPRLREAYLNVLQLTVFISFPVAGLIFALAPDFTTIVLGEKWMPMVPAMQLLVFAGLFRSIAAVTGTIVQAVGKPNIDTKWQIVRFSTLAILIYPVTVEWGLTGAAFSVFLSIFISNVGFSLSAITLTQCKIREYIKALSISFVGTSIFVLFIFGLKMLIGTGVCELMIFTSVGSMIYLIVAYFLDNLFNCGIRMTIKNSMSMLRGV